VVAAWLLALNLIGGQAILLHVEDGAGMTREELVAALEVRGVSVGEDPFDTVVAVTPEGAEGKACRVLIRDPKGTILSDRVLPKEPYLARTAALVVLDALKTAAIAEAGLQYSARRIDYIASIEMGVQGSGPLDMATLLRRVGHPEEARRATHREWFAGGLMVGGGAVALVGNGIFEYQVFRPHGNLGVGGAYLISCDVAGLGIFLGGLIQALRTNPLSDRETLGYVREHNEQLRKDLGLPAESP
jgi:hypothetical protein